MKMSSTKEAKVFKDLEALMDLLTAPPTEGKHPDNASFDVFDLQDLEIWQRAMSRYINHTIIAQEKTAIINYLLKAMRSPCRTTRIIGVMFFSELLHHAELLEKSSRMVLLTLLADKIHSTDDVEAYFAIKALANATIGAPREVEIFNDIIINNFLGRLLGQVQLDVSIQILQVMSKYVLLLKKSKLGSIFDKIAKLCADYLHSENTLIQSCCVELFADLARSYDSMDGGFKEQVKEFLPYLLVSVHSKDPQLKSSAAAALLHALPHIGFLDVEQLLSSDRKNICKVYQRLGQEEPAFLVKMMKKSIRLLHSIKDLNAVLKHLSKIKDALPYEELRPTALSDVWKGLWRLTCRYDGQQPKTINLAVEILSTKWKCLGTVYSPR